MQTTLIEDELEHLLNHRGFVASDRLRRLLVYLIECSFSDDKRKPNQRQIAEDVFERDSDFDPEQDAIVRVEVNKLR